LVILQTIVVMIKRLLPLILFYLYIIPGISQDKDFGVWYNITLERGITDKLDFEGGGAIRTFQFGSRIEQAFAQAGLDYKICDFLSTAASYRLANFSEVESDGHYLQHKLFLDLNGKYDVSVIGFEARMRLQTRIKTSEYDQDNNSTGRIRLKATYKTPSFPVNPYIYMETFSPLFREADRLIGKNRLSIGIEININKKHSVDVGYLFDRDYMPDLFDFHIIDLDYNIKFGNKGAVKPENKANNEPK
jgi:hypothetical protein